MKRHFLYTKNLYSFKVLQALKQLLDEKSILLRQPGEGLLLLADSSEKMEKYGVDGACYAISGITIN